MGQILESGLISAAGLVGGEPEQIVLSVHLFNTPAHIDRALEAPYARP